MIGEYTEAIRRLGKFGEVSLTIASEDPTFSPYYTLGRDQPLYLQVQLEVIGAPTTVHVKLFSSGLISASIVVLASTVGTTSEQNAASIERLKWLIARILPGAVNIEHLYPAA